MVKLAIMLTLAAVGATAMADIPVPPWSPRPRPRPTPGPHPPPTPIQGQIVPRPEPPVFRPDRILENEKPVEVKTSRTVGASNGLYRFVETEFTFTNPNGRVFAGELEFPIPEGATVCGYALEVNGVMTPGVVTEKERARAAFENEMKKGVDPGVVEHVKGNVWRTRIYPLDPMKPRRAKITVLEPIVGFNTQVEVERDGDDVFVGERLAIVQPTSVQMRLGNAASGWILWDASASRRGKVDADIGKLSMLPEKGDWKLVIFRNVPEKPVTFNNRDELLSAVRNVAYDGGTDFTALAAVLPKEAPKFLFSDEVDTLSAKAPVFDGDSTFCMASRPEPLFRPIRVRRLNAGEKPPKEPKEGRLLATAWAANRIADLSAMADAHKDEFVALGRRYGVASPVTSLIVFERLEQWLEYDIEPPEGASFHAEWKRLRAAQDDPIRAKELAAEHEKALLALWKERVEWWNDPIPKRVTPKSGVFEGEGVAPRAGNAVARMARRMFSPGNSAAAERAPALSEPEDMVAESAAVPVPAARMPRAKSAVSDAPAAYAAPNATVVLKAWDPKTPYIDALKAAKKGDAYAVYLGQIAEYGASPAFYLDCAGFFFGIGERELALRIISNLAELKLEDASLWRTMGWRLREAGAYDEAVRAFRRVLEQRGEEAQSRRDLALVLAERGKEKLSKVDLEEAMALFADAAFKVRERRSGRRSNDRQVSIVALEELNGLIAWCAAREWQNGAPKVPEFDSAFRRDLPLALRIVMSWDADETDIDIHVLDPSGEEAFYGHRRTLSGGFVSEDVTTGYGPEEYLKKEAEKGVYKVMSNYYASHQQKLTGAATVTATVYTGWATKDEKRQILTLRLDKPKDKHLIGKITVD